MSASSTAAAVLRRVALALAALGLAACAGPTFTARKGDVMLTIDHSAGAAPGTPEHTPASEGITEVRWLGLYGGQALFMKTEQGADVIEVPETHEEVRIHPRESTNIVLDTRRERELSVRGYRIVIEEITPDEIGFAVDSPS